jgi:hypothetical protein
MIFMELVVFEPFEQVAGVGDVEAWGEDADGVAL